MGSHGNPAGVVAAMSADEKQRLLEELERPTPPATGEQGHKRQRSSKSHGEDGFESANGGDDDLRAYVDFTKAELLAAIDAVQSQVTASAASSVCKLSATVQSSCSGLATQV